MIYVMLSSIRMVVVVTDTQYGVCAIRVGFGQSSEVS